MNKTQKILACVGYVQYRCIKDVVGCSEQMVYTVLKSEKSSHSYIDYIPKHKGYIKKKPKLKIEFKKGMEVIISGNPTIWEIAFVGREVVCLKNGNDTKNLTKDKITKIVLA